jgi:hypothetical protein
MALQVCNKGVAIMLHAIAEAFIGVLGAGMRFWVLKRCHISASDKSSAKMIVLAFKDFRMHALLL